MFCQFRKRLLNDRESLETLQVLVSRLVDTGAVNGKSLSLDVGQIILQVCRLSRLASAWEAIGQALEALVLRQPEWLRDTSQPHWYERYSYPRGKLNLNEGSFELDRLAQSIGRDADHLLQAASNQERLAELPELSALRTIWDELYGRAEGKVVWRNTCANCSMMSSL